MQTSWCSIMQSNCPVPSVPDQTLVYCFHQMSTTVVDSKARHFIRVVTCCTRFFGHRTSKVQSHCASQPKYTLPRLPKVYRKPLNYGSLHTYFGYVSALEAIYYTTRGTFPHRCSVVSYNSWVVTWLGLLLFWWPCANKTVFVVDANDGLGMFWYICSYDTLGLSQNW